MIDYIKNINSFTLEKVLAFVNKKNSFSVSGLTSSAKAILISQLLDFNKKIFFITSSEQKSLQYAQMIENLSVIKAKIFPYQDISLYETLPKNLYIYKDQVDILQNLNTEKFIITTTKALFEKFPKLDFYKVNSIFIELNQKISPEEFVKKLNKIGYKRSTMVFDIGEYSQRGDIIDVYSLSDLPVRIEFWGDEITDIRFFDNKTQKSVEKIPSFSILPVYKFIIENSGYDLPDEFQEKLKNEKYFEEISYFESAFNPDMQSIIEFLGKDFYVVFDEHAEIFSKYEQIDADYEDQKNNDLLPALKGLNHQTYEEFIRLLSSKTELFLDNFVDYDSAFCVDYETSCAPIFSSNLEELFVFIEDKILDGYKIIISTDYKSRLNELFKEFEIDTKKIEIVANFALSGTIIEDYKLVILTDKELFNKKSKNITSKTDKYFKENYEYIETINDIQAGDFVVHKIHGIGKYLGLNKQELDGQFKDYLTIEYANKDKLYMPAEQINMLGRYRGSGESKPSLSKMGGKDWNTIKNKVKNAVEDVAIELLKLYAKRKVAQGYSFEQDSPWQYEMEEAFPYTETPDQMKAIVDTKADMEAQKPMDRLICGDVGFGKTEVAIRAVFKAVMSGKQAAVIVPTTILALQHFETFKERFEPFGLKVELLSRFRTKKEQNKILDSLKTKNCDVVVGTHRLLQKDISFKDLALLVIDEEHRFGVKDKERLKEMKKNIDIISMSATPIPRTLYMSLSGIKDMSVINTPPKNRLPVKTLTSVYDEKIIKKAINYELDREGQVFFLHNRIEDIFNVAKKLQELLPSARIKVAHAQMDKKILENVMVDFTNHEFDVLVSTTIIESGLDIPNANTIIIDNADKLGLAQLYQLRGRVGRSERQAYCYCFFKNLQSLTKEAASRLQAIKDFTTLGSGYQIALRDIEIRGIGNILGTKQHGHMVSVGFDAYCELLDDAIHEIQNDKKEKYEPAIVDINIQAFIPDEWVGSKEQKMIEYKKLADINVLSDLEQIEFEWKDRFSKIPEEVKNLIELIRIRILATNAKIRKIHQLDDKIRIYSPFSQGEWRIISNKINKKILRHFQFTNAPKSCKDGVSILLFDISRLSKTDIFEIIREFLYEIQRICET